MVGIGGKKMGSDPFSATVRRLMRPRTFFAGGCERVSEVFKKKKGRKVQRKGVMRVKKKEERKVKVKGEKVCLFHWTVKSRGHVMQIFLKEVGEYWKAWIEDKDGNERFLYGPEGKITLSRLLQKVA